MEIKEGLNLGDLSPETIKDLKMPGLVGGDLRLFSDVAEGLNLDDLSPEFIKDLKILSLVGRNLKSDDIRKLRETPLGSRYFTADTDKVKLYEMDKMIDELAEEKANLDMKCQSEGLSSEESARMLEIDVLINRLNVTFLNFTPFIPWPNEIKGTHGKR